MKKYLVITNKGLIEVEDLTLIGSSIGKRGDSTKIGMFGSGWKYALAWMMRNEIPIQIFRGEQEIGIDTEIVLHRDEPKQVIVINGVRTNMTTEMGPKWQGWMALREIVSNAIDEGQYKIRVVFEGCEEKGEENMTKVIIPMTKELNEVMMNFEHYFAFDRTPACSNSRGRVFIKSTNTPANIYRKGIRCSNTDRETLVDMDFNDIDIDENRIAGEGDSDRAAKALIREGVTLEVMKLLLTQNYRDWLPDVPNEKIMEQMRELHAEGATFTCSALSSIIGIAGEGQYKVPNDWYRAMQREGLVLSALERINGVGDFVRTDLRNTDKIRYYLGKFGINDAKFLVGKMSSYSTVGYSNGTYYISDDPKGIDEELAAECLIRTPVSKLSQLMS